MTFTAADLQRVLRTEANTVKSKSGASNIRFILYFKQGFSKTYKLNPDGTWVTKPTATDEGLIRFEWINIQNNVKDDNGTTVTYVDTAYTETINPEEVIGYEFVYDIITTSQREIPSDE